MPNNLARSFAEQDKHNIKRVEQQSVEPIASLDAEYALLNTLFGGGDIQPVGARLF